MVKFSNIHSRLWIGGNPALPPGLSTQYYKGFVGCIAHVKINDKILDMLKNVNQGKIQFCRDNET